MIVLTVQMYQSQAAFLLQLSCFRCIDFDEPKILAKDNASEIFQKKTSPTWNASKEIRVPMLRSGCFSVKFLQSGKSQSPADIAVKIYRGDLARFLI